MALVFIKASAGSPEPTGFQKYDIVEILDDGQSGGESAFLEDFLIVCVPGKTAEELAYLKEPRYTQADLVKLAVTEGREGRPVVDMVRKYAYNFDEKMTAEQLNNIRNSETLNLVNIPLSDIKEKV